MSRSKLIGALLCIVAIVAAVVFVWGIATESYWAVAVPVAIGFLAVMALVFWIGWTMTTEAPIEPVKEKPNSTGPTPGQKT
ncbi:MAG: hypothetical protein HYY01_09115 [Chloroflexi bacterium]|nr:hypothetical protein [Chloroflexota bacterium]